MPTLKFHLKQSRRLLTAVVITLGLATGVRAQVYDFNRFLSGGAGGQDPVNRRLVTSSGAYLCLGVGPGTDVRTVRFTVWSRVPQPASRVVAVAFDTGRHVRLIRSIAVQLASPGVKGTVIPAQPHAFLRGMTPEFWVNVSHRGHVFPEGLSPGRMIVISATLNDGVTVNDVIQALHEGLNPATGADGLRVGLLVNYLAGGPPPGVGTIQDDGGFVTAGPSQTCK